jgi:hypothetical protein
MGGKDSMQTWIDAGRAHVDHVHLNEPGYAVLAQMVMKELLDAYGAYLVYAATPVSGLEDKTTTKKRGKKR